ncbi:ribonuclease H-like domain-containing protein [Tanacetum coccineum]
MWLFRHKYLADGTFSRYKARLVANGSTQLEGVDVDETFSLIIKPGNIRTVLSLATSRHWPIHQLDVKNAFLHGDLSETVYMHQPLGFQDHVHPDYGTDTAYLLLYVDDILLTASSKTLLQWVISSLHQEFSMTDLSSLNYFLTHMANCNPSRTPVDTESKLGDDGDLYNRFAFICMILESLISWLLKGSCGMFESYYSEIHFMLRVFLGNNLLSWSSKRQQTLSRSSAEAEYRGVTNVVAETCWLRNLLRQIRVFHVPSRYQYANIFTKGLPSALFEEFRTSLSVRCPPTPTAREC